MSEDDHKGAGYRRPPRAGQFKPGQSGNVKGRPKGAKNLKTLLFEQLNEKVTVVEHGKRRRVSKGEAMIIQHVNKAIKGDPKTTAMIINQMRDSDMSRGGLGAAVLNRAEDGLVIAGLLARMREQLRAPDPEAPGPAPSVDPEPDQSGELP